MISVVKTGDRYLMLFPEGKNCVHRKHILKMNDYCFVFCKKTKKPVSIYLDSSISSSEEINEFLKALDEKVAFLAFNYGSPYFSNLIFDLISNEIELI